MIPATMMMETVIIRMLCFHIASRVKTIAAEQMSYSAMPMSNMPKPVLGLRLRTFSAAACIVKPFGCAGTTTIKSTVP